MTQEVQPLTWQKRTNIEEHQQFFSKINEIIDNLAPTVEEAEAAIAQATQAVATANAASAAASAAASQAQTAASTVAGYDTRLTAAEDSIDTQGQQITVLQGRAGALETGMTALGTRMTAAETKNSQQDTAIAALQTADGQNVKINDINEYAVGLTGNQPNITGQKSFQNNVYQGINLGTGNAGWRVVARLPASTSGTSCIIMLSAHATANFVLFHYQCRNHVPAAAMIATTGQYAGKLAVVTDGTDEYLYINSTSNQEVYPIGGNRTVPFRLGDLPADVYATDADLQAAYTTVVIF